MAAFFWAVSYLPAYSASVATIDYNAARLRVDRVAPVLEAFAGQKPPIIITPELKKDACVLPNGNIIITTGLIASCESDDELAFIIAHELSHIVAKDYENSGTPGLTGSKGIPDSELREIKADMNAVRYLNKAGFNPYASVRILSRLTSTSDLNLRLGSLSDYLKTLSN